MSLASTGLRNYLLGTGSLKAALAGGEIRYYSGAIPADADAAIGAAVLLGTLKNAGAGINFDAAPVAGELQKASGETWSATNVAGGTVSFYRHVLAADTGVASTTAVRLQGTVALAGGDIQFTSLGLSNGAPQALGFYSVAIPAS